MLKKIINKVKSFFYALPFGMKAGDEILATSNNNTVDGVEINKNIQQSNVLKDLLNGELTQEVEELRYEMYKTDEEANNYKYIGSGQCVKVEEDERKKTDRRKKFVQENSLIYYGFEESVNMALSAKTVKQLDCPDKRLFKCVYDNECVKFRLESYFQKVEVNLKNGISTKLYFLDNKEFRKAVPLVNALKEAKKRIKALNCDDTKMMREYISRNEILSSLKEMSFTTFNASNNVPNGISYKFINPSFKKISASGDYVVLEFTWEKYEGGQLLSEKYYSASADEKFRNKERRQKL